ncbi:MAG: hypothetical protein MNPFHGCM_02305 [Gemmatimonadaceae bacterium]|nr:hypothetical protein [Gemmatimonadaceae bacterium]
MGSQTAGVGCGDRKNLMRQVLKGWRFVRWSAAAGGALMIVAAPARAQRDSLVLRATALEAEVARVARELVEKKRLQVTLMRALNDLALQLQLSSSDLERGRVEQEIRTVRLRLTTTGAEGTELRRKLGSLCNDERKPQGWLGVNLQGDLELQKGVDGELSSRYLDYPTIISVEPGSPAAKGGLQAGDRLLVLDGRDIRGVDVDISAMLQPGARLNIRVRRGVESKSLTVLVERRPESFQPPCRWIDQSVAGALREVPTEMTFVIPVPPNVSDAAIPTGIRSPRLAPNAPNPVRVPAPPEGWGPLVYSYGPSGTGTIAGAQVTAMTPGLGEIVGVDRGLLVLRVLSGTPAEQSGLRGGDVIVSASGSATTEPLALHRAINNASSRELMLTVVRRRKTLTIPLRW